MMTCMVILVLFLAGVASIRVMELSLPPGPWDSKALLINDIHLRDAQGLTICHRVKLHRFFSNGAPIVPIGYTNLTHPNFPLLTMYWYGDGIVPIVFNKMLMKADAEVMLFKWYHFCFIMSMVTDGEVSIVLDGVVRGRVNHRLRGEEFDLLRRKGLHFVLGGVIGDDACFREKTDATCMSSFSGEISDLHIFRNVLPEEEIKLTASCSKLLRGNVVDWQKAKWNSIRVNNSDTSLGSFCEQTMALTQTFDEKRSMRDSLEFCQSLGGKMPVPYTDADVQDITKSLEAASCYSSFIGWTDQWSEDTFIDIHKISKGIGNESEWVELPEKLAQRWDVNEPNGGQIENCVEMRHDLSLNDVSCDFRLCVTCTFPDMIMLRLRGLCPKSRLDTKYILSQESFQGKPVFRGYFKSIIMFMDRYWSLRTLTSEDGDEDEPEEEVTLPNEDSMTFPVGRQTWYTTSIRMESCIESRGGTLSLTLSVCTDDQFTCNNGDCVDIHLRCDNHEDCADGGDEEDCLQLARPKSYRFMPPKSPYPTHSSALVIGLDILIFSYSEIDFDEMTITVDFTLGMQWVDSRLKFLNLREHTDMNMVPSGALTWLWVPELIFVNTLGNYFSVTDANTELFIVRNGTGRLNSIDNARENLEFRGDQNPIVASRKYTMAFKCDFQLQEYPFDYQECKMELRLKQALRSSARLETSSLIYDGGKDLLEYVVINTSASDEYPCGRDDTRSCIDISFRLKRRIGNHILTTYLPTMCLLVAIFMTHFYQVDHYDIRIMVSLTGMLVIASLFTSSSANLPQTSYMTMLDVWMLFSFLLPFVEVMLHTLSEYIGDVDVKGSKPERGLSSVRGQVKPLGEQLPASRTRSWLTKQKIDQFARVFIPVAIITFNVYYWSRATKRGPLKF